MEPRDPQWERRCRESFATQAAMATLGVEVAALAPGRVTLAMPFDMRFTQQDGFLHAGTVATVLDSACGYAAFTLMPPGARVLTAEFKVNLLSPAAGARFRFEAAVLRAGRTLSVAEAKAYADARDAPVAMMVATLVALDPPASR